MSQDEIYKRKEAAQAEKEAPSFHYAFSHLALRNLVFAKPIECFGTLSSEGCGDFLISLVKSVSEKLNSPATFEANEIKVVKARVGQYPMVILEFPEPNETPENYMVSMVLEVDPAKGIPENVEDVSARYFTLEKSEKLTGESRIVFAEWNQTQHVNLGDGPEQATWEAFRAKIDEAIFG